MKSFVEAAESLKESPQAKLREKLLSDQIEVEDFLDRIYELDQSTEDRKNALENLNILEDVSVYKKCIVPEHKEYYFYQCSFAAFHTGQIFAVQDTLQATSYFKKSLLYAEQSNETSWKTYVEGTFAYFNHDLPLLRDAIQKLSTSEENRAVLEGLLAGLTDRGESNYRLDYLS